MPRRDYQAKLNADNSAVLVQSRNVRDIGADYPPPGDLAVRAACERDFRLFCETYFPNAFNLAWSPDHLKVIARMETVILDGGLFALAMPRGAGKTTLSVRAALWALLYGHRRFVCLVGATEDRAKALMKQFKAELTYNDRLAADFRQVCYPIGRLENNGRRCVGQLFDGKQTNIDWGADRLTFPTVPDSACDGANVGGYTVSVAGLTGALRGQSHVLPTGVIIRPEVVLLDDPQTRESAMSLSQSETRAEIINGDVLGMAGPGQDIAAIMPCTVVRSGDMADQFLDREKNPEWSGQLTKMVYAFPTDLKLWDQYREIRAEGQKANRGETEANEFYLANREAMDEGSVVAWPERFKRTEFSAIQHAMNIRFRNEPAFFAEYQNSPLPPDKARADDLTPDRIAEKLNRMQRGAVPLGSQKLTAFIDVHGTVLYYAVCAWKDDFTGSVVDYGTWPDQGRAYFALRDCQETFKTHTKGSGLEGQIYAALDALTKNILARDWPCEDGADLKVNRCLIDANWSDSTPTVYGFCSQSPHAAVLNPSHGSAVTAAGRPMSEWVKRPGEKAGLNWRLRTSQERNRVRHVTFDPNFWKSFVHARLATHMGDKGCLTLFGERPVIHRLFADHLCSENRVETTGRGRTVDQWEHNDKSRDNHWWDCYSEDMETLTRNGWVLFSELSGEDELATVNLDTDLIEYQRPTALVANRYEGEMIQFGGDKYSRIDLLVTPKHRMVIFAGQASRGPVIREAGDLTIWDKIKTTATWEGDGRTTYTIPATGPAEVPMVCVRCGRKLLRRGRGRGLCYTCYGMPGVAERYPKGRCGRRLPEVEVSAKDLAAFLGWYVAEGSCRVNVAEGKGRSHVVVISQNPGAKRDSICGLLDRLPWKYHVAKKGVVISNEQAYRLVCDLGDKYTKRVPPWIKDADSDVIAEFIRCAVEGDGWHCRTSEAYATVSPRLADDMMELYIKTGYAVSCRVREAKAYTIRGHSGGSERCQEQYHVHRKTTDRCQLRDSNNKPNFRHVPYDGMVYCASVPNGTLIVRRNGKVAICGNCLTGAAVAASMEGVTLAESGGTAPAKRKRVSMAEMASRKRA